MEAFKAVSVKEYSDEDLMDGILEGKKTDNNKADSLRNDILGSIRKQQKQQSTPGRMYPTSSMYCRAK